MPALSLVGILVLIGCGSGDVDPTLSPSIARHDSAEIEVVEITGSHLEQLPVWRISEEPVLSIGEVDGEEPYLFAGMYGPAVAVLEDDTLVIVDGATGGGTVELRVFDPQGRFVRKFGGSGQGPGEFTSPPLIRTHAGGGVVAWDPSQRRITIFDAEGDVSDGWTPDLDVCPFGSCDTRGVLGNGSLAVHSTDRPNISRDATPGERFTDLTSRYGLVGRDGYVDGARMLLPEHRALVRAGRTLPDGTKTNDAILIRDAQLNPEPSMAISTGQDHFVVVSHHPLEIRIFNARSELVRIIRLLRPPVPINEDQKRTLLERAGGTLEIRGRWVADYWPEVRSVGFGAGDDLWVRDYQHSMLTGEGAPDWITIFDIDGTPIARLMVRPDPIWQDQERGLSPRVISSRDHYRVITADSFGVPRLLVFDIVKP